MRRDIGSKACMSTSGSHGHAIHIAGRRSFDQGRHLQASPAQWSLDLFPSAASHRIGQRNRDRLAPTSLLRRAPHQREFFAWAQSRWHGGAWSTPKPALRWRMRCYKPCAHRKTLLKLARPAQAQTELSCWAAWKPIAIHCASRNSAGSRSPPRTRSAPQQHG